MPNLTRVLKITGVEIYGVNPKTHKIWWQLSLWAAVIQTLHAVITKHCLQMTGYKKSPLQSVIASPLQNWGPCRSRGFPYLAGDLLPWVHFSFSQVWFSPRNDIFPNVKHEIRNQTCGIAGCKQVMHQRLHFDLPQALNWLHFDLPQALNWPHHFLHLKKYFVYIQICPFQDYTSLVLAFVVKSEAITTCLKFELVVSYWISIHR